MTHDEYTEAVEAGRWPDDCAVPLETPFDNDAGRIQNLLLRRCQSVAVITSRKGSVRANHLHRTDWHYAHVATGCVLYFERPAGSRSVPRPRIFTAGTMFFTRPGVEHAMLFAEDSMIVTMARNVRSHDGHEADLERVAFVTPEIAREFVR